MTAIITGADGGIGSEITLAVAKAGYHVIMGCLQPKAAEAKRQYIINKSANKSIDILPLDLSSFQSVNDFSRNIRNKTDNIKLLMNNAGTMNGKRIILENGLEKTVCINCVGPHLLTRNLIPIMSSGSRVVNMVSLTYTWANLQLPELFTQGKKGTFHRLSVYSNSKYALLLNTFEMAERYKEQKITFNAADPGIVSTGIISMDNPIIDSLANIFFRPFIKKPKQGAETAIMLLLEKSFDGVTGKYFANKKEKNIGLKYINHPLRKKIFETTEEIIKPYLL